MSDCIFDVTDINIGKIRVCFRCGRKLKSEESRILGMGKICYQKWQNEQSTKSLFEVR